MPGRLIVCPTPIGNLADLSPRVRDALTDADLVACEDTRRTGRLYERLEIDPPPLVSNHDQNEEKRSVQIAQQIERGARVALIADAGMPGISDPGYRLIRTCIDRDLEVEVLPGPSAIPTALVASGLPAHRWRFEGFLPRRAGELARRFRNEARGEIVLVIGPAAGAASRDPDVTIAVDALRRLVQSGARPRAAASVVAALTGTRANDLYRALTGREPRE